MCSFLSRSKSLDISADRPRRKVHLSRQDTRRVRQRLAKRTLPPLHLISYILHLTSNTSYILHIHLGQDTRRVRLAKRALPPASQLQLATGYKEGARWVQGKLQSDPDRKKLKNTFLAKKFKPLFLSHSGRVILIQKI